MTPREGGGARRDGAGVCAIRIAAALIEDGAGRLLLVRKAGTALFMQAGGKIERGESPAAALCRELREEIAFDIRPAAILPLGLFGAPAAHEPGRIVEAALFHVLTGQVPAPGHEIAEAIWVTPAEARAMPLAPLTRDQVLPLAGKFGDGTAGR